jgi:hypothetical protein
MVGVITAVLVGSIAALVGIVTSDHSPAAALIANVVVALAALSVLMRRRRHFWTQAVTAPLTAEGDEETSAGRERNQPS